MDSCARSTTGARWIRSFLLTGLSVVLSALGHSLATGASPSWGPVAAGSTTVCVVVLPLTRRRLTVFEGAGLLAVLQLGLHVFFSATMPQASHSMASMHGGTEPSSWTALVPTVPMVCGHLVAAACIARLFRGSDLAAARVIDSARLYVAHAAQIARSALQGPFPARRHPLNTVAALLRCALRPGNALPTGLRTRLAHQVTRRGPPRRAAALD